ncbi:hypothetical protein [Streptomyces caniscabiei]|uniref:Uncharacterized protein n=1 Tax=Streptomyces caniscabiei TaxID=2746961 RepID=A0ABU4N0Z0_9ACTN|nr:hypothetical protein [Streptomyces caniscabiei]MBE4741480.1 hypothetical protein [Streptomyces caniscabiei]MBE4761546.1 hypothetical protein [Streptomyces caniscabiei]MBE4790042.1 hypothetical protein [Streptomyces caniscabiei]MBE4799195.1 hypothetical protein [Streptomyces caniscabiei]MDX2947612.1 hypothetical protein [Streptomyces caniscabiei]
MSGAWDVPAAERVAALRREAAHHPESGARELSDLELLNRAYESAVRDRIDTHDAYMRVLTDLRHHDDRVRAGAVSGFRPQIDRIARHVVNEHLKPYWQLVHRVEHLPERLSAGDIKSLRSQAASVRHWLRQDGPAEDRLDPGDAREHLSTLRTVLAALKGRRDVSTDDALRLMDAALNDGPLLDLFEIGTPEPLPEPAPPVFAGPGWTVHAHMWTYQPAPDDGFVTAVRLGDEWRIDLWSPAGPLLASGTAPENDVAALAEALVARAPAWTADRSDYAWRRFTDTANALRHTDDASPRVRAATARTTTPHRPTPHTPPPTTSPLPASAQTAFDRGRRR